MVMVNDRRRRTCPSCRADLTTDEGVWRCDWDGRHCTRCYEPLDERTCPIVHDAVSHAIDDAERERVAALRARSRPVEPVAARRRPGAPSIASRPVAAASGAHTARIEQRPTLGGALLLGLGLRRRTTRKKV